MSEGHVRLQLVGLEARRLQREGQSCSDPERLAAIVAELDVLVASAEDIRRDPLIEQLERSAPRRRRWWRRNRTAASGGDA